MKWSGLEISARDRIAHQDKTYFGTPPLDPIPSQYACPLPSMIASGSEVMVIPLPPITMGLKVEELVKSKVVVPAKVTTVPALSFDRSIELFVGA